MARMRQVSVHKPQHEWCHLHISKIVTAQFTKPRAGKVVRGAYPLTTVPSIHGHGNFSGIRPGKLLNSCEALGFVNCAVSSEYDCTSEVLSAQFTKPGFCGLLGTIPLEWYMSVNGRNGREIGTFHLRPYQPFAL